MKMADEKAAGSAALSRRFQAGTVLANLLLGVVYSDSGRGLWQALLDLRPQVSDLASQLGLKLVVYEDEGFAFLKTDETLEEGESEYVLPPRLMARRELTFELSLLLVLLRQRLLEFDTEGNGTRLLVSFSEMQEMMRVYFPDTGNAVRSEKLIRANIAKAEELGFLHRVDPKGSDVERYEVMRIIKAFFDADELSKIDSLLARYAEYGKEKAERLATRSKDGE